MQGQQHDDFAFSEAASSHSLDAADLRVVLSSEGGQADPFVHRTAALWHIVRHLDPVFALIVKSAGRVSVARSTVVVAGRAGLNLGLLMPKLRLMPPLTGATKLDVAPFADRYRKTVWDIAARLGRVEVDRNYVFKIGKKLVHIQADSSGFALVEGCRTVPEFLGKLQAAVKDDQPVAYTLGESPEQKVPSRHRVSDLFGAPQPNAGPHRVAPDGWPDSVPADSDMTSISVLAAVAQCLGQDDAEDDMNFSVVDASLRPILSGTRRVEGVDFVFGLRGVE